MMDRMGKNMSTPVLFACSMSQLLPSDNGLCAMSPEQWKPLLLASDTLKLSPWRWGAWTASRIIK